MDEYEKRKIFRAWLSHTIGITTSHDGLLVVNILAWIIMVAGYQFGFDQNPQLHAYSFLIINGLWALWRWTTKSKAPSEHDMKNAAGLLEA